MPPRDLPDVIAQFVSAYIENAYDGEAWAVNKAVHFNEWANFTKAEFQKVVGAFKSLLAELRCSSCESWLYVTPRKGKPESLRCQCGSLTLNLRPR